MYLLTKEPKKSIIFSICLLAVLAFGTTLPATAEAGKHKGADKSQSKGKSKGHKGKHKGKGKGKNKPRMSVCHYQLDENMEGGYKLLSLPVKAAMKMLANHEMDKEPFVGDDGVETCVMVEPPVSSCVINIDGADYTIAEYLESAAIAQYLDPDNFQVTGFNSDANSCDVITDATLNRIPFALFNNVPGWFDDGLGPRLIFIPNNRNTLFIESEEQYNDCAADIEMITNATGTCPVPFFDN